MFKKISLLLCFAVLLSLVFVLPAAAQEGELRLRLNRDFGYSAGGDIQGTFSLQASGPDDLQRVVYYIDDEVLGETTAPPWRLRFVTDNFPNGRHILYAIGYTASGAELRSNEFTPNFVPAGEGAAAALRILVPIVALIAGVALLSAFLPVITGRKAHPVAPGEERRYGAAGGAICPRCQRPFPLNFFDINAAPFHKLSRCPHCGRFGLVRRRSLPELRAAEAAELEQLGGTGQFEPELTEEEKLRRDLERSRYLDM
jgi:hypothetical protein